MTPLVKSMLFAFLGFFLWTVGDSIIRSLNHLPVIVVLWGASFSILIYLTIFSRFLGGFRATWHSPTRHLEIIRGSIVAVGSFLGFYTFSNLDLATAYCIIFLAPFLIKIISVFWFKETISKFSWFITILGFCGVLIVLRPGFGVFSLGHLSALTMTIFFSVGHSLTKYIGKETQTNLSLSLYQYGLVFLFTAIPAWQHIGQGIHILPWEYMGIFTIGLCSSLGVMLVSYAWNHAPTAYIAPIHYTQLITGTVIGVVVFKEFPDWITVLGGCVILVSGLLLIYSTHQYKKRGK
ncbi:MAG: DMT family transporter [Alphaproteobacteria bacterium]|nr:DMT family transporter [Alphaproteobacteria bacterium]